MHNWGNKEISRNMEKPCTADAIQQISTKCSPIQTLRKTRHRTAEDEMDRPTQCLASERVFDPTLDMADDYDYVRQGRLETILCIAN